MSQVPSAFTKGVESVLEACMFENWLRFYFISEKVNVDNVLYVSVPEQGMERIKELYPHLYPLAESMNGQEVSFESSQSAVCTFVAVELDGKRIAQNMSEVVFDSSTFQVELQLFNMWVQSHEEQLDQSFVEFGAWRNYFSQWRAMDSVKEWALKMHSASTMVQSENKEETVQ